MTRNECPDCKGKGYKTIRRMGADGFLHRVKCPTCKGSGLLPTVFTGVEYE